jgi:ParB family chromosome partitioning protein
VIVRPSEGGTYELIAGERRWRAAQIAGLLRIPAVIREVTDDKLLELALIENLQREELNPIEEATAYQSLINDLGLSQQQAAERVGKQRATVANALRLLNLPVEVQALVQSGQLSAGHAKSLAGLTDTRAQIELANRIVAEGLSVRAVEQLVRRSEPTGKKAASTATQRDPNVVAAEETLQSAMGTKVRISQGRTGAGRLELHFYSAEELDRIYDLVLKAARRK